MSKENKEKNKPPNRVKSMLGQPSITKNIVITKMIYNYLEKNPKINFSKMVQKLVEKEIKKRKKVPKQIEKLTAELKKTEEQLFSLRDAPDFPKKSFERMMQLELKEERLEHKTKILMECDEIKKEIEAKGFYPHHLNYPLSTENPPKKYTASAKNQWLLWINGVIARINEQRHKILKEIESHKSTPQHQADLKKTQAYKTMGSKLKQKIAKLNGELEKLRAS